MYLEAHFGGHLDRFENFLNNYRTKTKLKGGHFNGKNANSCIWGPTLWAVWDVLGGLPIGPELSNFKISDSISTENPISKGVRFMKTIANSCILGPILRAVLDILGVC